MKPFWHSYLSIICKFLLGYSAQTFLNGGFGLCKNVISLIHHHHIVASCCSHLYTTLADKTTETNSVHITCASRIKINTNYHMREEGHSNSFSSRDLPPSLVPRRWAWSLMSILFNETELQGPMHHRHIQVTMEAEDCLGISPPLGINKSQWCNLLFSSAMVTKISQLSECTINTK